MHIIELPHKTKPFLCPTNPVSDICEWKTGKRIPEEILFYTHPGFSYACKEKSMVPLRPLFNQSMMGAELYSRLASVLGFEVHSSEGEDFATALKNVQDYIDSEIPVILFGVDMYHLSYHKRYYHSKHVAGHIIMMCGYDDRGIFLFDNSKEEIMSLSYTDLKEAWNKDIPGLCKKNAYHAVDFTANDIDDCLVFPRLINCAANEYFTPTMPLSGKKGLEQFIGEMLTLPDKYDKKTIEQIYTRIAMFTASQIPELPKVMNENNNEKYNPHMGSRDKTANTIYKYRDMLPSEDYDKYKECAKLLETSGKYIETFTDMLCRDIIKDDYNDTKKYLPILNNIAEYDSQALMIFK